MKKIGFVGGISWVSTIDYYRFVNEGVNARLNGLNFAESVIYSLNFADVQAKGWPESFELLLEACQNLKKSNVHGIVLCANTAHLFADQLQEIVQLPIIHIVSETAKAVSGRGFKKVGLLGTKFTMEMGFYIDKLKEFGLEVLVPEGEEKRDYIQHTIKNELGAGLIDPQTKLHYITIVKELINRGAECIILGCTELPLLITQNDFDIPVFDTTKIHTQAIIEYILS